MCFYILEVLSNMSSNPLVNAKVSSLSKYGCSVIVFGCHMLLCKYQTYRGLVEDGLKYCSCFMCRLCTG